MKVAIPVWEDRVSPVFDVAGHLLVAEFDDQDGLVETFMTAVADPSPAGRVRLVKRLGAEQLICGAISRPLEEMLISAGIKVVPHICGKIEDVLTAWRKMKLEEAGFLMPGCGGRRCRRRGGRRHGRGGFNQQGADA